MKFELTQHAKDVLVEREIPLSWVEKVFDFPKRVVPDAEDLELEHRLGHISEYGNRVLRVVVNRKSRPPRIITVFFDRTVRKKI